MIKKTITFTNFFGEKVTVEHYFHMPLRRFTALHSKYNEGGGVTAHWNKLIENKSYGDIIEVFETLIDLSYGVRSEDGNSFIQTNEVLDEFKSTPAYDELLESLLVNSEEAVEFLTGILPKSLGMGVSEGAALSKAEPSSEETYEQTIARLKAQLSGEEK